jgi:hypothetical protein
MLFLRNLSHPSQGDGDLYFMKCLRNPCQMTNLDCRKGKITRGHLQELFLQPAFDLIGEVLIVMAATLFFGLRELVVQADAAYV